MTNPRRVEDLYDFFGRDLNKIINQPKFCNDLKEAYLSKKIQLGHAIEIAKEVVDKKEDISAWERKLEGEKKRNISQEILSNNKDYEKMYEKISKKHPKNKSELERGVMVFHWKLVEAYCSSGIDEAEFKNIVGALKK